MTACGVLYRWFRPSRDKRSGAGAASTNSCCCALPWVRYWRAFIANILKTGADRRSASGAGRAEMSASIGKKRRKRPLVFSTVPFCHGAGAQK